LKLARSLAIQNGADCLSFQANYFTKLIEVGHWKIRQFIKPQVILGVIARIQSATD
jgi:hypothetical protein